jgi:hypothetical protein
MALTHHICTSERKRESEHARACERRRGSEYSNEEIRWIERARPDDKQRDWGKGCRILTERGLWPVEFSPTTCYNLTALGIGDTGYEREHQGHGNNIFAHPDGFFLKKVDYDKKKIYSTGRLYNDFVVYYFCTLTVKRRLWPTKYRRNRVNFASFVRPTFLTLKGQWGCVWAASYTRDDSILFEVRKI